MKYRQQETPATAGHPSGYQQQKEINDDPQDFKKIGKTRRQNFRMERWIAQGQTPIGLGRSQALTVRSDRSIIQPLLTS